MYETAIPTNLPGKNVERDTSDENVSGASEEKYVADLEPFKTGYTNVALNVEDVAIRSLRMAGIVAKEVLAKQIGDRDQTLGALALIGMHVSDQADLRQWSTLPETIQIYRTKLTPGVYDIKLELLDQSGQSLGEYVDYGRVIIKRRKKTFLNHRVL